MLETEPNVILLDLVSGEWTVGNTSLAAAPRFHTGWYDYGSSDPQVTFTDTEESVVEGGDTGITGLTGGGGISQVRAGTVLVNAWGGTREDMRGAGVGGVDLNPKTVAYEMAREVNRILNRHADGTLTDAGDPELHTISGDGAIKRTDVTETPAVFRYEVTARFSYIENTTLAT